MKRKIYALICAVLCGVSALTAQAASYVTVNGEKIQTDTVTENDKIYVPIRGLFEQIGCQVDWKGDTKTAEIAYKDKTLAFSVYDTDVLIIDGKMYIPLRAAGEALDTEVLWDNDTKTVTINTEEEEALGEEEESETKAVSEKIPPVIIDENSSFAARLSSVMPDDINYIFSPAALKYAVAMAAMGADKETVKETAEALDIDDYDGYGDKVRKYLEKFNYKEEFTLYPNFKTAGSVWINREGINDGDLSEDLKKAAEEKYNGNVYVVGKSFAVNKINDWYKENTKEQIVSVAKDNDFSGRLLSADSFAGGWNFLFYGGERDAFTDKNGVKKEMFFRMNKYSSFDYYNDGTVEMIALPYINKKDSGVKSVKMYIALTDEENVDFEKYIDKMKKTAVDIYIPSFKTEFTLNAEKYLPEIGINGIFDKNKQALEGVFNPDVRDGYKNTVISDILQKNSVYFTEYETIINARERVVCIDSLLPDERKAEGVFKADRPFTYFIRDDEEGEILFMGKYVGIS